MLSKCGVLAGFIIIILMGSSIHLHGAGNILPEETTSDNENNTNCVQGKGAHVEVIHLNYVKAEDVARVLVPLFSEHATIIPYEPSNSVIIKVRQRSCKGLD